MGINVMQTNQEKTGLLRSGATLQVFGIGMSVRNGLLDASKRGYYVSLMI